MAEVTSDSILEVSSPSDATPAATTFWTTQSAWEAERPALVSWYLTR